MALTADQRRIASADPDNLTPMERGELRALAMGTDRVEVAQLRQDRDERLGADQPVEATAYQRGVARAAASAPPTAYTIGTVTGRPADTKLD